tara:strand:- start:1054 stop:1518 length:465 start_codon:yes stop_codon:yes gene_type:complete
MTIKDLADHLDLSRARVHELINQNVLQRSGKQKGIDINENRVRYIRYLRQLGKGRSSDSGDLNEERTRLTKLQADKAELELQEKEEELVSVDIVKHIWTEYIANVRSKLLAIPTKCGHLVQSAKTYGEAENIIKKEIYETLEELSANATKQKTE